MTLERYYPKLSQCDSWQGQAPQNENEFQQQSVVAADPYVPLLDALECLPVSWIGISI